MSLTISRFRWVACQLDYLCGFSSDFERREALGHLPPTLHETYLRVLQRLTKLPAQTQSKIQMCFQFIAFCPIKLYTIQLREAISTPELPGSYLNEDNMVSEDDISSMCGSLLKKSADEKFFEFAHFSVREFLEHTSLAETPSMENYRISQSECYRLLATQSLRYLQLSNFILDPLDMDNVREHSNIISAKNREGYSFHRLAATYSLQITADVDSSSILHGLMNSLFDPSKTSCFVLYAMSVFSTFLEHCSTSGLLLRDVPTLKHEFAERLLRDDFRPIHLAAALNLPNVCDYLITTGSDPTTKSSYGTPLELSLASVFRFLAYRLDSKFFKTHPDHFLPPIKAILPSGTQRNSTVEILERSSLENLGPESLLLSGSTPISLQTVIIALVQNDFRVLQRQLSRGVTLSDSMYTTVFWELMHQSFESIERDEEPLLAFLKYVGSLLESESGWQLEIGRVIWNCAVELGLPFTRDPTVTDFRITLSKDALVTRAIASIKGHDLQGLQECLADGRLDVSERHRDTDDEYLTLLHLAVIADNLPATSHLAKAGCDPNIPSAESVMSNETWLPIHHCSSIEVFEELLASGAQMTDVETKCGENIWHMYATAPEHETEFFRSIAQRYPLETAEALLARAKDGHTPIGLVLEARESSRSHEEREKRALEYISICSDIVGFWSAHEPVFGAAAEFGSERIIRQLIEAGARSDPEAGEPSLKTPLHRISIDSSSGLVRLLKELYPQVLDVRYKGQLPLQFYLERCARHKHPIDNAVAQQLLSFGAFESIDGNGTTLWEHYCRFSAIQAPQVMDPLRVIPAWLLEQHAAMQVYENATGRNGLSLIFSSMVTLKLDVAQELESLIPYDVLDKAIKASCSWESATADPNVLRFLQFALCNQSYRLVEVLLEHDVNVSEIVDDWSAVQIACRAKLAIIYCSVPEGRELLGKILERTSLTHLNEHGKDGLTILHRIATPEANGWQLHWLIRSLLTKGVNINQQALFAPRFNPLTYHVAHRSLSCAEFLLEMGADPGMADHLYTNAAMEASIQGFRHFMDQILKDSKTRVSPLEWDKMLRVTLHTEHGQKVALGTANVVHLICFQGHVECLEFYINNNFIDDLEAASTRGWTLMHVSALGGCSTMIEYLHSNGCQVMPQTEDGLTPLHIAVNERRAEACKILIRLGAKDIPNAAGFTPTMYASKQDDKYMLQLLSRSLSFSDKIPQQLNSKVSHDGSNALLTGLEMAIEKDDIYECERLYMIGCPINVNIRGWSPLVWALHHGHFGIAEWLLNNGANSTACMCKEEVDERCFNIIEICLLDKSKSCKLLTKLVDHCIQDGSGWPLVDDSGLLTAVSCDNIEGLSLLLKLLQENAEAIRYGNSYQQASFEESMASSHN